MTWKDFIKEVEEELKRQNVDLDKQVVEINYIDFTINFGRVNIDYINDEKVAISIW